MNIKQKGYNSKCRTNEINSQIWQPLPEIYNEIKIKMTIAWFACNECFIWKLILCFHWLWYELLIFRSDILCSDWDEVGPFYFIFVRGKLYAGREADSDMRQWI